MRILLQGVYGGKVRYKNPEVVIRELKSLKEAGIKEVFFQDDTLNMNRPWLEEILDRIITEKLNMKFRCPFRANEKLVDYTLLSKMRKAGFWLIFYGVESGNQAMLDKMGKGLKLDEIERAFRLTKESGIKTEASFIIGLMGDSATSFCDTYDFYRKIDPFWAGCSVAIPFPGTKYYNEVKAAGNLLEPNYDNYAPGTCMIENQYLEKTEIEKMHKWFSHQIKKVNYTNLLTTPKVLGWTVKRTLGEPSFWEKK